MTKLHLTNNYLVQCAYWPRLSAGLQSLRNLKTLELGNNGIGIEACEALVPLLARGCPLTTLSLGGNIIDDECVGILARALRWNNSLETLNLDRNESITIIGWRRMLSLVCDVGTSPTSIYHSNHTLRHFVLNLSYTRAMSARNEVCGDLEAMLALNRSPRLVDAIHGKIWRV